MSIPKSDPSFPHCGNLGGFVGPYITGFIKETTGSFAGAWVYLACSLTCAGLLILTFRKQLQVHETRQTTAEQTRTVGVD